MPTRCVDILNRLKPYSQNKAQSISKSIDCVFFIRQNPEALLTPGFHSFYLLSSAFLFRACPQNEFHLSVLLIRAGTVFPSVLTFPAFLRLSLVLAIIIFQIFLNHIVLVHAILIQNLINFLVICIRQIII